MNLQKSSPAPTAVPEPTPEVLAVISRSVQSACDHTELKTNDRFGRIVECLNCGYRTGQ